MKIAILGATSQIAKDLILSFSKKNGTEFSLFARNIELLEEWVNNKNLKESCQVHKYSNLSNHQYCDVIINFVGIGDPAKAQRMGGDIFEITEQYVGMALEYIKCNEETKYIFLSSGAIYGGNFKHPVNKDTLATIDINNLASNDWYAIAKLYVEAKHRSLQDLSIVDVRVFNYFSNTQDMSSRFLITDIVRALKNNKIFKTSSDNIVRDFVTPPSFYALIQAIIDFKPINTALDCYTKSPVSKFDLLSELKSRFGLNYEIEKSVDIINATGSKINYYSVNKTARNLGYRPKNTSLDGIIQEIKLLEL